MTLRVDDDVILVCEATSESRVTMSWEREGAPLPAGRSVVNGGKLTITEIQKNDYGVYRCIATSDDGQARHSTTLAVICKWKRHYLSSIKNLVRAGRYLCQSNRYYNILGNEEVIDTSEL